MQSCRMLRTQNKTSRSSRTSLINCGPSRMNNFFYQIHLTAIGSYWWNWDAGGWIISLKNRNGQFIPFTKGYWPSRTTSDDECAFGGPQRLKTMLAVALTLAVPDSGCKGKQRVISHSIRYRKHRSSVWMEECWPSLKQQALGVISVTQ